MAEAPEAVVKAQQRALGCWEPGNGPIRVCNAPGHGTWNKRGCAVAVRAADAAFAASLEWAADTLAPHWPTQAPWSDGTVPPRAQVIDDCAKALRRLVGDS